MKSAALQGASKPPFSFAGANLLREGAVTSHGALVIPTEWCLDAEKLCSEAPCPVFPETFLSRWQQGPSCPLGYR